MSGLMRNLMSLVAACCLLMPLAEVQAANTPTAPVVATTVAAAGENSANPANTAPHNASATWRDARGSVSGFTTVKGVETGVLIDPQGNTWRAIRNGLITPYGGVLLVIAIVGIAMFHLRKGTQQLHAPETGRTMERFSPSERRAHWIAAISFVCLGLSGVVLLFGKHILLWLIGYSLFSWLAVLSKNVHVLSGFLFVVGVVLMFWHFWRDNLWHASDAAWIRKGGGLFTGEHVPSRRFNFGEKTWFWIGVCGFGLVMILSGLALTFPNVFASRQAMQTAEIIHAVSACIVMAMSLGHIYMGTLGMAGALDAMKTGQVDETWAKEHHELWYQEELAKRNSGGPAA